MNPGLRRHLRDAIVAVLPRPLRLQLAYLKELEQDLFLGLPAKTKRTFLRHCQQSTGYRVLVETGTYQGDLSAYAAAFFECVHTVELDSRLATAARARFGNTANVTVHEGDSADVLARLLPGLEGPVLFWLDAHFSGGVTGGDPARAPVVRELRAIAASTVRPVAILIDDARVFGADPAYPGLAEVLELLRSIDPSFQVGISSDVIWAAPARLLDFAWQAGPDGEMLPPSTLGRYPDV